MDCPECTALIPREPVKPGSRRTRLVEDPTQHQPDAPRKNLREIVSDAKDFVATMPDHEITAARNAGVLDPRWIRPSDAPTDIADKLRWRQPRPGSIEREALDEIERLRYIVGMYRDTSDA